MLSKGTVIGVFQVQSYATDRYTQADADLLTLPANTAAIAIENARLYAAEQAKRSRVGSTGTERTTQLQTANAALERRALQLEGANKSLETFAYSISHDLRAPLRAVSGFAEILLSRCKGDLTDEGQHYLDNIVVAAGRMETLINDLLLYSRVGRASVKYRQISPNDVFHDVLTALSEKITETRATIQLPPPGQMPALYSDGTILKQIFTNILENALVYHQPDQPPRITITYEDTDSQHIFSVIDQGLGISAEYHEKIFNVFQRLHTSDEYPGTGIGLAIVKKSAELLGATVGVISCFGEGSKFWIKIPKESNFV